MDVRTKKLATALSHAGAVVSIFAYTFNREEHHGLPYQVVYRDSVEPKGSQIKSRPLRILSNLTIKKAQMMANSINEGIFGYKKIAEDLVNARPDVVIGVNADTLAGVAVAAQKLHIPFAYETYEFWPDHVKETAVRYNSAQRDFILAQEKQLAREASLIVTVSDYLAEQYKQEFKLSKKPAVIYNAPMSCAAQSTPAHKPLRVLFLGNIQQERNVEYLVRAVANTPEVELTFLGRGNYQQALEELASDLGISERVVFKEPVPYEEIAEAASQFDIGVVCHKIYNRQMEGALPNKFFEYLAGGLAVVAPRTEAFKRIENFESFGVFVDTSDVNSLASVLSRLVQNPDEVSTRKKAALVEAQKYCGETREESIIELYESIGD